MARATAPASAVGRFSNPLAATCERSASCAPQSAPGLFLRDIQFQRLLFRPAAGRRNYSTGALENVGTNGFYWSSSSYNAGNVNAGSLNFNSGNVNPLNNNVRANGFPVRCVQHLPEAVFIFATRSTQPNSSADDPE